MASGVRVLVVVRVLVTVRVLVRVRVLVGLPGVDVLPVGRTVGVKLAGAS